MEGSKGGSHTWICLAKKDRRGEERACLTELTDFAQLHQTLWSLHSINIARGVCVRASMCVCVALLSINIKKDILSQ